MKCAEYAGALEAMREGFQANNEIFQEVWETINSVNASYASFMETIPKIDISLPTKRRSSSFFRRLSGIVEFPNAEKRFTELWKWLFSTLSELPTCGGVLTEHFLPLFKEIWHAYEASFHEIEERIVEAMQAMEREELAYQEVYTKYQQFCRQIESKHRQPSEFNTLRATYPQYLQEVLTSLEKLNNTRLECGKTIEYCLLDFENADKTRKGAIDALFVDIISGLRDYGEHNKAVLDDLREKVSEISSMIDVEDSVDILHQTEKPETLDLHLPGFDFNISEFIDSEAAFASEMKKWKGKLPTGEFVTVIQDTGVEYKAETSGGVVITIPLTDVEKVFERKLAKMTETHDVLQKDEIVLVIDEHDSHSTVMNVFYNTFDIESRLLTNSL